MIRPGMACRLAACVAAVSLLIASCSQKPDHTVMVQARPGHFAVTLRTIELQGLCYAPAAFHFNGALGLANFVAVNRWAMAPPESRSAEELDPILSAPRQVIGREIELNISRDSILARPSYFVFTVFPCDAPTRSMARLRGVHTVVGSADLPTFYPPGYRETPSADEARFLRDNPLMTNEAVDPKRR